ncbi:A kinase anchor protein [Purpureocillium lilacinum]|uniref:RING-type E3 ubiquitin transferase n=1 Tax=Purpureocillium lilacinum TaxID=33203 RepID=A0A179H4E1_PURLI|nr:A kinase anchor protein [Purpureocillium lilacinum]
MASPSAHHGPTSLAELETSDQDWHGSSVDADSMENTDQLPASTGCPWQTSEFHDGECSRYFDCPGHQIARGTSTDGDGNDHERPEGSSGTVQERRDSQPSISSGNVIDGPAADDNETRTRSHGEQNPNELPESSRTASAAEGAVRATGSQAHSTFSLPIRTSSMVSTTNTALTASQQRATPLSPDHVPRSTSGYREAWQSDGRAGSYGFEDDSDTRRRGSGSRAPRDRTPDAPVPRRHRPRNDGQESPEFVLPRWQPDAEVTYCPICHTQFSFFVRKKCGRVVCNSCSPHRIIIPHQYIVRPPGSDIAMPPSLLLDGLGAGYFDVNGPSGGERVRLCNPCVPDPNTAPPQSPTSSAGASPRSSHQRSRSTMGGTYAGPPASNRYGTVFASGRSGDVHQYYSPRTRSITMVRVRGPHGGSAGSSSHHRPSVIYPTPLDRLLAVGPSSTPSGSRRHRHSSFGEGPSSSRQRALPPPPQIAEEDECPICHRELPSRELPDFEELRESHITMCIQAHSTYGSPMPRDGDDEEAPLPAPRRTGMYSYAATEKDCIDDAECTICLEEFTVGVAMARLECLCRFHRACISAWFVNHPGRCPVHQHDGFGF